MKVVVVVVAEVVDVGDPRFWKAPTSGSVRRLADSIIFLSFFNLKQKHHSDLLVGKIGENLDLDQTCELL